MADGTITFSTALDNSQLEADMKQAEREVERLEEKVSKTNADKSAVEAEMERAEEAIHETEAAIDELKEKMEQIPSTARSREEYEQQRAEIEQVGSELEEQNAKLEEQVEKIDKLNEKWQELDERAHGYSEQLDRARNRQAELGEEYAASYSRAGAAATVATAHAGEGFDRLAKKINKTVKKVFVFSAILGVVRAVKSYLSEAVMESDRFAAAWGNLKATVQGVANFIAGVLTPVLTGFVNMVAAMITTLARAVDSVFKTSIVESIQRARAAAQATDSQAKATRSLGKAAKEAVKQLLAFDEVNAMAAETADGAADSLEPDAGSEAPLDWGAFDVGKIDAKLAEIMLIVGAALLAVGAVLAFSGINIPLGITLMAIGALMIYTAYEEQWDALPQEVREAVTGMLVVAGLVLFLLGVVLAFAGPATVAIGIGMMAAGAALLWTAVAVNWDSMPEELKGPVSALMTLLGGALLVIGAVLAFSGGGTPLGIALMVAGAATLAGVAAINWDSMPEEVQAAVTAIMGVLGGALLAVGAILALSGPASAPLGVGLMLAGAVLLGSAVALNWNSMPDEIRPVVTLILTIVGGALLAVGAILCFTGAAAPLGVALMAAGAASLVGAAALNWDFMTDNIRNTVSTILGIVGGAMIVIGIILCVTGVGIPVGIACILAGAASLVAAAAINWNFIQDKVREIWQGVVSFWNANIAQIFTPGWWQNLFRSIVNGLIWAVNSGLNAFGSFVSWIGDGVGSLLRGLGVGDFSLSLSMPQIPYLAQGAVIPPNRKFLAVLGDQASGNNIETPESLMRQVVREEAGAGMDPAALQQAFAAAMMQVLPAFQQDGGDGGDVVMVLQVGAEQLAKAVNRGNASLARRGLVTPEIGIG